MHVDPGMEPADRAAQRFARLRIFQAGAYLAAYPDVAQAGVDPVAHALNDGAREGRRLFADTALARAYGRPENRIGRPARRHGRPAPATHDGRPRCSVFVHSVSDDAYRETAIGLAADLTSLGFDAILADERVDPWADHGIAIFVAPHEFFRLGLGPLWADLGLLEHGFVVIDDPVESPEGGQSLRAVLAARGVIETSAVGAGIWSEAGIPTHRVLPRVALRSRWLEPADLGHPLMLAAPERARRVDCDPLAWDGRPLDLLFFGREGPRRNVTLGRLAATLAAHRCFVYCQQGVSSEIERRLHRGAHWRVSGHLAAQARVTLYASEGRFPALDRRHVVAQAMAGGSAVVSTVRLVEPGLEAGVHYLTDDPKHLGALIDWTLLDPDGRRTAERVRDRAFDRIAALNRDPLRLESLRDFLLADDGAEGRTP